MPNWPEDPRRRNVYGDVYGQSLPMPGQTQPQGIPSLADLATLVNQQQPQQSGLPSPTFQQQQPSLSQIQPPLMPQAAMSADTPASNQPKPAGFGRTLLDLGGGLVETFRGIPGVVASSMEGVENPYAEVDWKDRTIEENRQRQQANLQALRDSGEFDRPMGLGMPFTRGEWAETTQSFPYTAATMGPALVGGAVGSAIGGSLGGLGGPAAPATVPAGVAAGRAIGGTLGGMLGAYLPVGGAATNQFIRDSLDKYRQDFSAKSGREPSPEEIDAHYKTVVEPQASRVYHGEAAPEAVGTVAELGLMKSAIGDVLNSGGSLPMRLAKAGGKVALSAFGIEPATETLTQQIQQPAYAATGLTNEKPRSLSSVDDWLKSAGEVYKQAAATSLFFSALGIPAGSVYGRHLANQEGKARASDAEQATAELRTNLEFARESDIAEALSRFDEIENAGRLPKSAAQRIDAARQQLLGELILRVSPESISAPMNSQRGMAGYLGFSERVNELDDAQLADLAGRVIPENAEPTLADAAKRYQAEIGRRQALTDSAAHFEQNPDAVAGVAKTLDDIATGKPMSKGAHGSTAFNLASLSDDMLRRYQLAGEVLLRDHSEALGKQSTNVERSLSLLNEESQRRAEGQTRDPEAIREADLAERAAAAIAKGKKPNIKGLSFETLDRMASGLEARASMEPRLADSARMLREAAQQGRLRAFNPQGQQQPGIQSAMRGWNVGQPEAPTQPIDFTQDRARLSELAQQADVTSRQRAILDQEAQRRATREQQRVARAQEIAALNQQNPPLATPQGLPTVTPAAIPQPLGQLGQTRLGNGVDQLPIPAQPQLSTPNVTESQGQGRQETSPMELPARPAGASQSQARGTPEQAASALLRQVPGRLGEQERLNQEWVRPKTPTGENAIPAVASTDTPQGSAKKPLVLWGYKPGTADEPIKIAAFTKGEQQRREKAGWKTAAYEQGTEPVGLREQARLDQSKASNVRGGQTGREAPPTTAAPTQPETPSNETRKAEAAPLLNREVAPPSNAAPTQPETPSNETRKAEAAPLLNREVAPPTTAAPTQPETPSNETRKAEAAPLLNREVAPPSNAAPSTGNSYSMPSGRGGATPAQTRADLSRALGADVVARLEQSGRLVIHDKPPTGAAAGAQGWVDQKGVIHLVPANLESSALSVVLHESAHLMRDDRFSPENRALGRAAHAVLRMSGLQGLIGNPSYNDLIQNVYRLAAEGNKTAQAALAKATVEPGNTAEEALSYIVEYADEKLPIYRRIMSAIRAALYRLGIKVNLTPADVRALALSALKARAKDAALVQTARAQEAFSQPTTETDAAEQDRLWQEFQAVRAQFQANQASQSAFDRWFGKGVEGVNARNGKPLVLYHGTNNPEFNRWDESRSGQASQHPTAGLGFFMTAAKRSAARYGSRLLELHAKIDNPYYMTDADLVSIEDTQDAARFRRKLQAQGYDAAVISAPGGAPYVVALRSNQVKLASNDNPTENEDFRYSRPGGRQSPPAANPLPAETMGQAALRAVQDRFIRFRVIQDWLKQHGVNLTPDADVYGAESLLPKVTAARTQDAREKILKPLIESAAGKKWSIQGGDLLAAIEDQQPLPTKFKPSIPEFLHAQHAIERNAQIAKIKGAPKDGSGLNDAQAHEILTRYRVMPNFSEFSAMAEKFRTITDQTRRILRTSGIISAEQEAAWTSAYKKYVPLKGGPDTASQQNGTGPGISVNPGMKRALGHRLRDENIVENIWRDHERAIYLSEKQKVTRALRNMLDQANNQDIGTVGRPEKKATIHQGYYHQVWIDGNPLGAYGSYNEAKAAISADAQQSGRSLSKYAVVHKPADPAVVFMSRPMLADNEVALYENGQRIRLQLNDELLARAARNLGVDGASGLLKAAQSFNRWLSHAYTGYNPEFILANVARDMTTGMINLSGQYGGKFALKTLKGYGSAVRGLWKQIHGKADPWVDRYRAAGGSTGAAYLSDLERIGTDLKRIFQDYQGASETLQQGDRAGAVRVAVSDKIRWLGGWIEKMNQVGENALRVATFRAMVEAGHSDAVAARAAGDVTVNFNRKGELTTTLGGLYLFFNPSIQGTKAMWDALAKGSHRGQAMALAGSLTLLALTLAELARGGDDADEEAWKRIPGYVKDRNLVIKMGDIQGTIPIPYGYGAFWSLGNILSDLSHGEDKTKAGIRFASSLFEQFSAIGNPFAGNEADIKNAVSLLPTALKPMMEIAMNRNSLGRPIMPEMSPWNTAQPDSARRWRSTTGSLYDGIASGLNRWTGGNAYQAGAIDISPETLSYLWRTFTGGAGKFAIDSMGLGTRIAQGVSPELREIPVLRKFVRAESIQDARTLFNEQSATVRLAVDAFNAAKRAKDLPAMRQMIDEQRQVLALGKVLQTAQKMIRARRELEDRINQSDLSIEEKRAQLKTIEKQESSILSRFTARFEKAKQESR